MSKNSKQHLQKIRQEEAIISGLFGYLKSALNTHAFEVCGEDDSSIKINRMSGNVYVIIDEDGHEFELTVRLKGFK